MKRWPESHRWPLLVVTVWRPPVAGLEELGWQQCDVKFYEVDAPVRARGNER
jgi:hypothetical protein